MHAALLGPVFMRKGARPVATLLTVAALAGCTTRLPHHAQHSQDTMVAQRSSEGSDGLPAAATAGRRLTQQPLPELARFYWPYAALAADVYRTGGDSDMHTAMALASPWLRAQLKTVDPAVADRFYLRGFPETDQVYRRLLQERCEQERSQQQAAVPGPVRSADRAGAESEPAPSTSASPASAPGTTADRAQDAALPPSCATLQALRREDVEAAIAAEDEPNRFEKSEPQRPEDCVYSRGHQPLVPIDRLEADGWSRVPELHKRTAARGWRLFVPELAVDVWRRDRPPQGGAAVLEYAIVFRGTVGGGGWMSNFRGLTAMLPFVWDQYRQAEIITSGIIDQIDRLHALADDVLGSAAGVERPPTQLLYTAVGHSLGGGLAQHIYMQAPRITRVVAFDPSPIDGASLVPLDKRQAVADGGRRAVDFDPDDDSRSAIHLLYEHGEVISQLAPCHSGPVWGAEGGPQVRCQRVNFARGNAFRQHNMAQLACNLYLAQRERRPG